VVHNRVEEIAEINASKPRPSLSAREDERFHFYGSDVVIVTSKFQGQATRATDVFVRQNGHWRIASAQWTPIQ